ncbi:MAG: hypothetical protein GY845_30060 [Planctomycetes bacterium]|nr:hypothetical protein [Planctomycetota bacterium]
MDKQLSLKNIQKEIDAVVQHFTAVHNTPGLHDKGQKLKNRLEEIRNTLRECLGAGYHNLDALRTDSAAGLRKTQQVTGGEVEKIKKLIEKTDSVLNHYQNITRKTGKLDMPLTDSFYDFEEEIIMNKSEEKDPSQVTYQTIALLDAERYGRTDGIEVVEKYPRPDLGSSLGQRTCGISDKIRMGSGNPVPSESSDYRITIPEFCRNFHGGDI